MKFSSSKRNVVVWNGGEPIRFKDGICEVDEEKKAEALSRLTYVKAVRRGKKEGRRYA